MSLVTDFVFTTENSIELPGPNWVALSDMRPCGICGEVIFDVVTVARLVKAQVLEPEHWGDSRLSVQCRNCFDPETRPAWERGRIREVRLGEIDTRTGIYTKAGA